jgi:hypothetical protein
MDGIFVVVTADAAIRVTCSGSTSTSFAFAAAALERIEGFGRRPRIAAAANLTSSLGRRFSRAVSCWPGKIHTACVHRIEVHTCMLRKITPLKVSQVPLMAAM